MKKLLYQDKVTIVDVRSFRKEASSMVVAIVEKNHREKYIVFQQG